MGCRYYEKANLNGFVYDASFQLNNKKPSVYPIQRNPRKVGGGNLLSWRHPLYVTSMAAIIQWMLVAKRVFPIRMWKHRLNGSIAHFAKRGRTNMIATGVRVDQRSPSKITWNRASKRKRKLVVLPHHRVHVNVSHLHCYVHAYTASKWCWRGSSTSSLTDSSIIVWIRFNHSTESLTIFCLFDSGALHYNYALERAAAWYREHFPRKIGETASGRVCSPVTSTCTASNTTISSVSVDVFDDIVTKSMLLDFPILPFQSNVGYDVILSIDILEHNRSRPLQSICLPRISAQRKHTT
jgi:hypothetical protein